MFVDNDDSFFDEGVVISLIDKEFLVFDERLKKGWSARVIRLGDCTSRKRPFHLSNTIVLLSGYSSRTGTGIP